MSTPPDDVENPPDDFAAIDDADMGDVGSEVRALIEAIRAEMGPALRLAVQYTADEYEVLFARDDVAAQFAGHELEERVETLVMKGLGDPATESALFDFGSLDATVRFYDDAQVLHFPYREWSGFVFVLDRETAPLVDLVSEHFPDD